MQTDRSSTPTEPAATSLPRLVLVVEDEALIALDMTFTLQDAGYRVLGPASSVAEALALLDKERPAAAVLDFNVQGEVVTSVARILHQRSVPFVMASACLREELSSEPLLRHAPYLSKPISSVRLLATLEDMLPGVSV